MLKAVVAVVLANQWRGSTGWSGYHQAATRRNTIAPRSKRRAAARRVVVCSEGPLASKRVLVTGASGGIGAAVATALGGEGCRVILHYNKREEGVLETARRVAAAGGTVDAIIQADFRSQAAVEDVWALVDDTWDGLDCLVNNAGVVTKKAATERSFEAWDETLAVNLHAPYRLACGARERMRPGSAVVMVSSVHGSRSVEWMSAYAASKAALDSLTKTLGVEWAEDGVRVVGVAPGPVPVERTQAKLSTPESQALWRPHLPLGRMGTVSEIADAVVWLLSSPASAWITGQTITLDGGLSARLNMPVRPRPADEEVPARPVGRPLEARLLETSERRHANGHANGHAQPIDLATARERAVVAADRFGTTSSQAADAWAVVEDLEYRTERAPVATLEEECQVDATSVKCLQLAKDLEELDGLIAKGPDSSSLREAARRMLREIEERHDSGPFRKKQ